ncbi:MAG: peptidase [Alphaproteobacteria bacterium]|nr:MAG: peptidase [Alphaproteobacteria bacterium]
MTPEAVVAEARRWLGTPYAHQASVRGAGCDCLGLVRGLWRALVGPEPEPVPPYTPDWGEPAGEELLLAAAMRRLRPLGAGGDVRPGEILLFRIRAGRVAKHLGVASGPARFIHAHAARGVVESSLSRPWRQRIVGRFALPGVRWPGEAADGHQILG